ncbi:MAG TPA: DUF262 domain-containing protein [Saprospiraceae bacterium]|nr:DUF262 domain-containing protein [Saprospiraceae bacterium]
MSNGISKLYSLEEIFDKRIFRIPDYQRGYSWKDEHINALWEDLENLENGKIHYTGMITVQKPPIKSLFNWMNEFPNAHITRNEIRFKNNITEIYHPLYIADGQQRLITILILLVAVRESNLFEDTTFLQEKFIIDNNNGDNSYFFGYEVDMPSYDFLISQIYSTAKKRLSEAETIYTKNLLNAKNFFDEKIQNFASVDNLLLLYIKIIKNLQFNFYEIPETLDIFTVFETMNYRGKPLSTLELLKNRLIHLVSTSSGRDQLFKDRLRKKINDQWTIIYQDLAQNKESIIGDDDYLRIHWLLYFEHDYQNSTTLQRYKQNLLDEYFIKTNLVNNLDDPTKVSLEKIEMYVESLGQCTKSFFNLRFPNFYLNEIDSEVKLLLTKINKLAPKSFFEPLILAGLHKNELLLVELLTEIERYLFLVFGLAGMRSNTNKVPFLIEANKYYRGEKDINIIIKKLMPELKFKDPTLSTREPVVKIDKPDILINDFKINQLKSRSNEGFLNWKYIKYFMGEYEESLHGKEHLIQGKYTLELIFPPFVEIPKRDPQKIEKVKRFILDRNQNWGNCLNRIGKSGQMYLSYTLGNIILINRDPRWYSVSTLAHYFSSSNGNALFNALSFDEKKCIRHSNNSFCEKELYDKSDWGPSEILNRGIKLLNFLESRWRVQIDDQLKREILYLNRLDIDDDEIYEDNNKEKEIDLFSEISITPNSYEKPEIEIDLEDEETDEYENEF